MITAYAGMDSAKEAMEYGAFSYISKPITYKDLAPLMKKALEMVKLKKLRDGHAKELEEKVEARTAELKEENKKLKLVEKILSESEERYRNLSEQSPVGIGVATLDGKMVYMNWKMAEITGYSSDEIEKINLSSTYENVKDRKKVIDQLNRDGMVNDFHVRLKRKDGTLYDAQLSVSKVHIGGQDLLQTICVDVTERKKIEEDLRRSEERFRMLAETSVDYIFQVNMDGTVAYRSPSIKDILGYTPDERKGKLFDDVILPSDLQRVKTFYRKAINGETIKNFEINLVHKNGKKVPVEVSAVPVFVNKEVTGLFGIARDTTERKKAEEEKNQLLKAIEIAKEAISIQSSDLLTIYTNDSMDKLFGYKKGELIGKHISILNSDPTSKATVKFITDSIKKKGYCEGEIRNKKKDGTELITYATTSTIKDKDGKILTYISTQHDITEKKKAEEAIKELAKFPSENPNPVLRIDDKGNVLYMNEAIKNVLKEMGLREKGINKILPGNLKELIAKSLKTGKPFYGLEVIIGDEVYSYTIAPVAENRYVNLYATDITERKQTEEALRESRDYLNKFTDSMWDAVFSVKMPERVIDWANDSFDLIGYKPGECIGKTTEFFYPSKSEFHDFGTKLKKTISAGKDILHAEQKLKRKNGEVFPAEITTTIFREKGEVVRVTSIVRDVTERKKAEEALRENEKMLSEKNVMLQEKNIALREVMDQLEAEKDRLGKQINTNVDRLLLPLVTKLRSKGSSLDKTYIDLLEENLKELASQFGGKLSDKMLRLTQKEIEMCNMIKQGLTSKEIAKLLDISHRTVETHRNNIRKKLGIGKQEVNLVTYLKNL